MPIDVMQPSQREPSLGMVCADGIDTAYLHAGRGIPLIVFARPQTQIREALLARLSQRHWVIVPDVKPVASAPLAAWLREFLEALTPRSAVIVATEPWVASLFAFALLEPERIAELVFLLDAPAPSRCPDMLEDRLERSAVPLFSTWLSAAGPGAALDAIERYLKARSSDSPD